MKVVINGCFGGFSVTEAVYKELGIPWDGYGYIDNSDLGIEDSNYTKYRAHPRFIQAIETVGLEKASGDCARLQIIDIPDDVEWYIEDYDGNEHIAESHRTWG